MRRAGGATAEVAMTLYALFALVSLQVQPPYVNPTRNPEPVAVPPGAPDPGYEPNRRIAGAITMDDYPLFALRAGLEGKVVAELQVTREGTVSQCFVLLSSGNSVLDKITCDLIKDRFRYTPARREGRALLSGDTVEVNWVLPAD